MSGSSTDPHRIHVNGGEAPQVPRDLLVRAVRAALEDHGVEEAELSVTLLDDAGMADLNRRWLERSGTTDVLAFTLSGEDEPLLGDVYLGWEQARRQAADHRVSLNEELARLAIHGTLHLLGHDHPEGPERRASSMWRRQEALLRQVADPVAPAPERS